MVFIPASFIAAISASASPLLPTEAAPTGRSAGSLAWAGLANTYFWIDPTKNIAGVILMQLLPFADPQALQTFAEFESGLYKVA